MAQVIDSGRFKVPAFPDQPVTWKTPVKDMLGDDFILLDDWATTHLTLEDALSHRTGMGRHDRSLAQHYDGHRATIKDAVRSLRHLPLTAEPRTLYQYCNLMFIVATHAVETLTSRWMGDVLKDRIWKPLGMDSTFFLADDALNAGAHVATGYDWDPENQTFNEVTSPMPMDIFSGAGAILSSVDDYTKWLQCLINEAEPLSKASHDAFKAPRVFMSSSPDNYDAPGAYALGWRTSTYRGRREWNHSGGTDAFGAQVNMLPDQKFGVVTFANTAFSSNAVGEILAWKLIDDKMGVPREERKDWEAK